MKLFTYKKNQKKGVWVIRWYNYILFRVMISFGVRTSEIVLSAQVIPFRAYVEFKTNRETDHGPKSYFIIGNSHKFRTAQFIHI